ncbi:hypothetical protein AUC68_07045 [Methyloceanibacter methanicus]|uniref:Uncharacterized protein n=1 Tax=Methyloceanibacter methanicus TaxID=1774968 RepID=A0A1E3VZH3_9HYPH|nr:hypothetical protein [Methyloceanibacter methanicus]ODR98920.1 hypothetical protein AUC68_07045 [Methyloceanibacter methanicus]
MSYEVGKDAVRSRADRAQVVGRFGTAERAALITPDDDNDLNEYPIALEIGESGDVAVIPMAAPDDTPVTFKGRAAGSTLLVRARRVMEAGTTAGNIVGLYPK